ncbi:MULTISPECIES: NACHT domain-containing protein [Streptomyces]|uniref:NACHT domain-containing protein n=1 Tax=Streptomyces TaxID=1883 RepID=UPI00345C22CA
MGLAVFLVVAAFWTRGLEDASALAGVLSVVLAVPPLAVTLLVWHRRSSEPAVSSVETVIRAKRELAAAVRQRWTEEARRRDQDGQHPMPVVWRLATRGEAGGVVLLAGAATYQEAQRQTGELADRFMRSQRRRLVIVGGRGAGKTTLSVQLTLSLLGTDDEHAPELVPVPVSASGWNPDTEFAAWMAGELGRSYPHVRALAADVPALLVGRGHVLPVLDGLDELPDAACSRVLQALDTRFGTRIPLILTCRTEEFEQALPPGDGVLTTAAVLAPEPLTPAVAAAHLRRNLPTDPAPAWRELLDGLEAPGPRPEPIAVIAEAVTTPLDLGLLHTTYVLSRTAPDELLRPGRFADAAALRGHLLDRLIPTLLERSPPSPDDHGGLRPRYRYRPETVRRGLEFLAYCLAQTPGSRDIRWWGLAAAALPRRLLPVAELLTSLILSIGAGAVVTKTAALPKDLTNTGVMTFCVLWGGILGLLCASNANNACLDQPRYLGAAQYRPVQLRSEQPGIILRRYIFVGTLLGAAVDSIWTSITGGNLAMALAYGAGAGAGTGAAIGLFLWADVWGRNKAGTPAGSLRADRSLGLCRIALLLSCAWGLLGLGWWGQRTDGQVIFAVLMLAVTALVVTLFSGSRAWLAYTALTAYVACMDLRSYKLPRRIIPFLEDAHRLGLLRAVGPLYQFRHAEFQDYLADPHQAPVPGPGGDPAPLGPSQWWWRIRPAIGIGVSFELVAVGIWGLLNHRAIWQITLDAASIAAGPVILLIYLAQFLRRRLAGRP